MLYHSTNSGCNSLSLPNAFLNRPELPSGIEIDLLLWIGYTGTIRLEMFDSGKVSHHKRFHSHSPLLHDDHDGPEEKNEDHQTACAGPEDQTHVFGMLGNLQSPFRVLTGSCREERKEKTQRTKTDTVDYSALIAKTRC